MPREGGLLDQPGDEAVRLEKIMDAFARYEEYLSKKRENRDKNRKRHEPKNITVEE